MELRTLTSRFFPRDSITEFTSAIWTERYSAAGDVELVVPATPDMVEILAPGIFLSLRGTKEIMMLETHSIENDLLTVKGSSLPKFLNERVAVFQDPEYDGSGSIYGDYSAVTTAGQLISSAVYRMVINPTSGFNLDWARDKIPGLELGDVDDNGTAKPLSFADGPLYDSIQRLATEEGVGFKLYLDSTTYSTDTYVLKFTTYRGKNRTSEQQFRGKVRLSPKLDSLTGVKEVSSLAEYKNVIYVSYKNAISKHYIQPDLPIPVGFERRALFVEAPDIYLSTSQKILDLRAQVARNALANHIYVQMIDGRVSPQIDYKFGKHYYLGDVVELEGFSGFFTKARITEYIRSQDAFGEQAYPTLAVIDPLQTGYIPDLAPDRPDDGPDGPDDTDTFTNDADSDLDIDDDVNFDWDPTDDTSDYDIEHDPNRRGKRRRKTTPPDPNPDPVPNFSSRTSPDDVVDDGHPPTGLYLVTGYYPDQNQGEAVGYLEYGESESVLRHAWIYEPQDPESTFWVDLIPRGWTLDNTAVVIRVQEDKSSTPELPWSRGFTYWLKDPTRPDITRLTDTIPTNLRQDGPVFPENHGYLSANQGAFWCGSKNDYRLYLISNTTYPEEFLYSDGTYSTDPDLLTTTGVDHGSRIEQAGPGPIELYAAWGGTGEGTITNSELSRVTFRDDFPSNMRWSDIRGLAPSPDGTKLVFNRRAMGSRASWQLQALGAVVGGYFTLTVGLVGNVVGNYYETAHIPYNATDEEVWEALLICGPHLQDPRLRGYPYQPYFIGSTPLENGGQMQLLFDDVGPSGVWITVNNSGLETGPLNATYSITTSRPTERDKPFWYICEHNGANLEDLDLDEIDSNEFNMIGWSSDSTKLLGTIANATTPYNRYVTYDVETGEVAYPLDDYFADNPGSFRVPPRMSPNGAKLAWSTNAAEIWVSDADGSNPVKLHTQSVDDSSTNRDSLVVSYSQDSIVWSFDSTKLAIVDGRDEAPVWFVDLLTNIKTQIWAGTGWDNSNEQQWIYDMQKFDG